MPCFFLWSSKCDEGSNIHLRCVCAPSPDALSPPNGALQAVWLEPGSVHAAWGCCEGQLFPSTVHGQGNQKQQAKLPSTEKDRARAKEQKGWQWAHPVRCSYASLKSVLAENLQLQGFRQLGTPGNRKGWSLPKAEDQVTLNA